PHVLHIYTALLLTLPTLLPLFFLMTRPPPRSPLFPYTTLFRSYTTMDTVADIDMLRHALGARAIVLDGVSYGTYVAERYALAHPDRKSTRLNSSHVKISYAVFCLKKKKKKK